MKTLLILALASLLRPFGFTALLDAKTVETVNPDGTITLRITGKGLRLGRTPRA